MKLIDLFTLSQARLEKIFSIYLKNTPTHAPLLQEAMAYSVLNDGKRIRPALVYMANPLFNAPLENCDIAACAIEFIHTYSLIHDDLPAMDNSDLRRGKPACHKKYGEAIAILAGDTLQPLSFEVIATHPAPLENSQRISMIQVLAKASGYNGMAAGQAIDIVGVQSPKELTNMYKLKTGALLNASLQLGAIAGNIQEPAILDALEKFAYDLGLAFQIQDDLLDMKGEAITGKTQGVDAANNKATYPILFGIEKSAEKIQELHQEALTAVSCLGDKANILHEFANYIMQRKK